MNFSCSIYKDDSPASHEVAEFGWEGFVIENLLSAAPTRTVASFYRTSAGAEIDLVLEVPNRGKWAIEIKRGLSPRAEKGFHIACDDIKPDRRFIVYSGHDRYPLSTELEVIGLREMASLLTQPPERAS